jgi:hypothetical protein
MKKMKKIFSILFLCIILIISCSSPEKKIKQSFTHQRYSKFKEIEIQKIEIYDTVYFTDIVNTLNFLDNKSEIINKKIDELDLYRDSIRKNKISNFNKDSLFRELEKRENFYNREIDHLFREEMNYANLGKQIDDSIYAYKVMIKTDKRTFNFLVSPLTFTIISPTFDLFIDSLKEF